MNIQSLGIPDVKLITPKPFADARGFFCETWNKKLLADAGLDLDFVQDNHALSKAAFTVRGLHFQLAPMGQAKLVRVVRGAIFDVALDVRRSSPTFGRHVSAVLSAENFAQILVPSGFAHAYMTTEPDTEVFYKVTNYYAPDLERGILWNDPALGIAWPAKPESVHLSDKDRALPRFADAGALFD